jgi:hypothetical protein
MRGERERERKTNSWLSLLILSDANQLVMLGGGFVEEYVYEWK